MGRNFGRSKTTKLPWIGDHAGIEKQAPMLRAGEGMVVTCAQRRANSELCFRFVGDVFRWGEKWGYRRTQFVCETISG